MLFKIFGLISGLMAFVSAGVGAYTLINNGQTWTSADYLLFVVWNLMGMALCFHDSKKKQPPNKDKSDVALTGASPF